MIFAHDGLLFCMIGLPFIIFTKPQNHPEMSGWFFNKLYSFNAKSCMIS